MKLKQLYWNYKKFRTKQRIKKGEKSIGETMPLRYYLERKRGSRDLIVVYSAFPEPDKPAAYNYVTTLSKIKANKLFMLDEYGSGGKGCYYLGKDGGREVEKNVFVLLEKVKKELSVTRTIHVGSSKGGWSALYFGLSYEKDQIVLGGAQFRLGDYTMERMPALFAYLTGTKDDEIEKEKLNRILPDRIDGATPRNVYLHYSDSEHTYEDSMLPMKTHLLERGFPLWEDVAHYTEHGKVGLYFAELLPSLLRKILSEGIE